MERLRIVQVVVLTGVLIALSACPLPYEFSPTDLLAGGPASSDPANPAMTAPPQLLIIERTNRIETSSITPSANVDIGLYSETRGSVIYSRTQRER